jgi:putative copper resistance protein D
VAPLGGTHVLTSWRLDVPTLVVVVLLGAWYCHGVWRLRRRGERWGRWPAFAFLVLGLGSLVLVTMSSLGVYDRVLFWPRAVQYIVLLGVSPLLLAMGEPLELARRSLSDTGRRRLRRVLRSRVLRVLSFPLVGAAFGAVGLLIVYLTPLYHLTLTSELAHHLVWLGLLVIGAAFFVPELDPGDDLLPAWCGYAARVGFSVVDGLLDAVPGIVVMTMHGTIAAAFYAQVHRTWGPSLHWDQTIGGGLMLTVAELVALPFLAVLVLRWVREDERLARETDRRLDAAAARETAAARAATGNLPATPPAADDLPLVTRPWWETDPGPLAQRPLWREPPRP